MISNSTASPSANDLKPSPEIAEKWTKTSSPPSCSIKPNPLASLNHFTVPSANVLHHLSTLKIVQESQQNKKGKNHMFRFLPHRLLQADCTGNRNKIPIQKKRYLTCFQKSTILSKSPCNLSYTTTSASIFRPFSAYRALSSGFTVRQIRNCLRNKFIKF